MADSIFDINRAVDVDETAFNPSRAVTINEPDKSVFVDGRSQVIGFPDSYTDDQMNFSLATDVDKKNKNNFFGMVEYGGDLVNNLGRGLASFFTTMPQKAGSLISETGEVGVQQRNQEDASAKVYDKFILDPGELAGYTARRISEGLQIPERVKSAGDKLIDMNRRFVDKYSIKPTEDTGAKKVAFDLGSGLGSIGSSIGLTFLTKRPELVAPMFGFIQKADVYQQGREAGLDPVRASEASNVAGVAESALEFVGLHVFFDVIKSSNKFARVALRSLSEGTQEGSQQLAQDVTTNAYGITETKFDDIAKRVGYAAAIGAVAGLPVSAVVGMAERQGVIEDLKDDGKTDDEARQIVADIAEKQIEGGLLDTTAQIIENETSQFAVTNEERGMLFDELNKSIQSQGVQDVQGNGEGNQKADQQAQGMEQGTEISLRPRDNAQDGMQNETVVEPKYKTADTFYSQAAKVIDEKMPNAATPEMVRGILSDKNGVKKEELEWMGVDEFLAGKNKVTKQELKDFIAQNQVQVKEKTLSNNAVEQELKKLKEDADFAIQQRSDIEEAFGGVKLFVAGNPVRWGYKNDEGTFIPLGDKFQQRLDDIQDIIAKHEEMQERVGDDYASPAPAKFASYQLPGGENYRELLLTFPGDAAVRQDKQTHEDLKKDYEKFVDDLRLRLNKPALNPYDAYDTGLMTPEEKFAFDKIEQRYTNLPKEAKAFRSGHFDEPNILAHVRMNDRTDADGKKVLFIEEVQSDWHQKGRKQGYAGRVSSVRPREVGDGRTVYEVLDANGNVYSEENTRQAAELVAARDPQLSGVPDAPFKKTWHELAMKRMLRYAAENGYDKLAWTTGEQQAERYDLSKQVSKILWNEKTSDLDVRGLDGHQILAQNVPADKLADFIGKDAAKQIIEKPSDESMRGWKIIEGEGLKVGGEGMKGFYDQILPSFMNKYAKKWGGRVGSSEVSRGDINFKITQTTDGMWDVRDGRQQRGLFDSYNKANEFVKEQRGKAYGDNNAKVHSIDITPSMRESVLSEGQPLFKEQPSWEDLLGDKAQYEALNKAGLELIRKYVPQLEGTFEQPAYLYTKDGRKALGMYVNGRISVVTGAKARVYIHEIGHAVFNMFLTEDERNSLLSEAGGSEEKIMDDFEKYFQAMQNDAPPQTLSEKAKALFDKIIRGLKKLFASTKKDVKDFYNAILSGEYRNAPIPDKFNMDIKYKGTGDKDLSLDEINAMLDADASYQESVLFDGVPEEISQYDKDTVNEVKSQFTDEENKKIYLGVMAEEELQQRKDIIKYLTKKISTDQFDVGEYKDIKKYFKWMTRKDGMSIDSIATEFDGLFPGLLDKESNLSDSFRVLIKNMFIDNAGRGNVLRSQISAANAIWKEKAKQKNSEIFKALYRARKNELGRPYKNTLSEINTSTGVSKGRQQKVYSEMQALKIGLRRQVKAAERASRAMFNDMQAILRGEVAKTTEAGKQAARDIQSVKDEIVRMVKESIPANQRGKFLIMVSNAKDLKDIVKAEMRIESLADSISRRAIIQEIKDAIKTIGKSNSISIEYVDKIRSIVNEIDLVKRTQKTMSALKKTQEYIEEQKRKGEDVYLPERLMNQLRILSARPIEEIETSKLISVLADINNLIDLGKTKLRVRGEIERLQKERDLSDLAASSVRYDAETPISRQLPGTKESLTQALGKKFRDGYTRLSDLSRKLDFNLMPMDVVFDMLDGGKGYTGNNFRIFKARIDAGWNRWLDMQDSFKDPIHELANKLNLNAKDFELIGIYAVREQEGGVDKLLSTGYSQKDIESVTLNDEQMQFYEAIRAKLDEMRPFVAETMRTVYNKPLGKVRNYFPFMTDFEAMSESEIQERFGDKVKQFGQGKRKNVQKEFTEKRTGGDQKVKINAMQVYEQHVENASYLVTLGKDIKYLSELAKSPMYREAVGDIGQNIVVNWLDLLARKGRSAEKRLRWLDIARKNVGSATLGFKLSSALIQPTALMDGAALIGNDAFAGFSRILTDRNARKFIKENFPEIRDRISDDPSYMDYETSGPLNKLQRAGFMPLKALDGLTAAGVGMGAYEQNLRSRGLEVDLSKPDAEAIKFAQLIVRRTQSTGMFKDTPAVFNRGEALTGNISINRAFLQFQSFIINRWSVLRHDMYNLGIRHNDPERAARVAFFMIMAAYAEAGLRKLSKEAIDLIVDGELDDNDKEKTINQAAVLNMAQTVPFLSQAIGAMEYGSVPSPTLDVWVKMSDRLQAYNKSKRQSTKERNALLLGVALIGYSAGLPGTAQALQYIKEKNR